MNDEIKVSGLKLSIWAFLGGIAWMVHFLLIYALAEFGCEINAEAMVRWSIILLTILLFLAGILAIYKCFKLKSSINNEIYPSGYFLVNFGIFSNALFSFIIAYQSIPIFYFRGECL